MSSINYPLSDSTSGNIDEVLFSPNVDVFSEDWTQMEYLRGMEESARFNSIVKHPGVVAKKADIALKLYPTITIQPNTLKITKGTGFTRNGARITLLSDIVISDMTQLPNWDASDVGNLYLVLRKKLQDYSTRANRIDGTLKNTRRRIQTSHSTYADTMVEWLYSASASTLLENDGDIIVLGRLTTYNTSVFGYTETTDGRWILRPEEIAHLEITGGIMQGDIDMDNKYNLLNVPQWGSIYWKKAGVPHNIDFIKLFAKTNTTLFLKQGIKFAQVGGQYGIQFTGDANTVKFSLLPNQTPPVKLDFSNTAFLTVPENYVLQYEYSLTELGLATGGINPIVIEEGAEIDVVGGGSTGGVSSGSLRTVSFANTANTGSSGNIIRVPICFHYLPPNSTTHYLIFSNGTILKLNDSIDENGNLSYYLRTDGGNYMTGDVRIIKQQANLVLQNASGALAGDLYSGIQWKTSGGIVSSSFLKCIALSSVTDGFGNVTETGDQVLFVADLNGENGKYFRFKQDGRLNIEGTPTDAGDVVTLGFGQGANGFLRKNVGTSLGSPAENGYGNYIFNGSLSIKKFSNGELGYLWLGSGTNYATNKIDLWAYGDAYLIGSVQIGDPTDTAVGTDFKCYNNVIIGSDTDTALLRYMNIFANTYIGAIANKKKLGVTGKLEVKVTADYDADTYYVGIENGDAWIENNIWTAGSGNVVELNSLITQLKIKTFWLS